MADPLPRSWRKPTAAGTSQPDLHLVQADRDLDGLADVPVRHAVANRVDVDEAVGAHAARQAVRPHRQGMRRQRPQRPPLVALEADARLFVGGAVDALVGDLDDPPR